MVYVPAMDNVLDVHVAVVTPANVDTLTGEQDNVPDAVPVYVKATEPVGFVAPETAGVMVAV
jgi:hypothetical protein